MLSLYFKIALRYLQKNILYSFINILGLTIGVASFILIMTYVNYEKSYDRFEGSEHVYRPYMDYLEGDQFVPGDAQTYNSTGPTFKKEFPEVLEFVRLRQAEKVSFVYGENILQETQGYMADPSYFDVFGYPLLQGDEITALSDPYTMVVTESFSIKLFGSNESIGKTVSVFRNSVEALVTITGILKDIPENTHLKTKFLISYTTMKTWDAFKNYELNWNMNNFFTYLKLDPQADFLDFKQKVIESDFEEDEDERHNIEAIQDIHLLSNKPYEAEINGSSTRIKFLTAIAFIILILSWLNYINLSTTKSLERAKEVGIRKVAGAQREQLIAQSLLESMILSLISIGIAIGLAFLVMPFYSQFTGKEMSLDFNGIRSLAPILSYVLIAMLLAGIYPALLLSSYTPIKALKGKIRASGQGMNIRKSLIIIQFIATIILLIGTIVVTKQINYIQDQPIGVDIEQVVAINGDILSNREDSLLALDFLILVDELRTLPFIESVSSSNTYPGDGFENLSSFMGIVHPDGTEDGQNVFYNLQASPGYFEVMGFELIAGRQSYPHVKGAQRELVINETLAKTIGFPDPINAVDQTVKFWGSSWPIVGVIKDYHHFGLKNKVLPLMIWPNRINDLVVLRLNDVSRSSSGLSRQLAQIEGKWKEIFPQSTFDYTLVDKKFEAQYTDDKQFSAAFLMFTILAIFIASLGLFGLTSYTCIQRRKEIGVRKVNGASIFSILKLLNLDFIKWIGIALIVAVPLGWYVMKTWLEGFAVRTDLSWWIFFLAALIAMTITLVTVSWQSFIAANANPVEALKDE